MSERVNTAPRDDSCRKDKLRNGNGSLGSWSKVRGQNAQRFSRAVGSFYQRNGAGEDSPRERATGAVHEQGTAQLGQDRPGPSRVGRRLALIRPRCSSCPTLSSTGGLALLLATSDCFADTHHSQMTIWEPDRCKHALLVFAGRLAAMSKDTRRTQKLVGVVVRARVVRVGAIRSTPHTEATQPKQQSKCGILGALGSWGSSGKYWRPHTPVTPSHHAWWQKLWLV